jgi:hypothetical protein
MSSGIVTALGVVGLIALCELLDVFGVIRRRLGRQPDVQELESQIRDLEVRIGNLESRDC